MVADRGVFFFFPIAESLAQEIYLALFGLILADCGVLMDSRWLPSMSILRLFT